MFLCENFKFVGPRWVVCFLAAYPNFSLIKDLRDKLNTSPLQPSYSFGFLETCGAVIIIVDNRTEWVYLYTIL